MSATRSKGERREDGRGHEVDEADLRPRPQLDPVAQKEFEIHKYNLFEHRSGENVDAKTRDAREKSRANLTFNNISTVGSSKLQITGRTLYLSKSLIEGIQEATFTGARSKAKSKTAQCVRMRISDLNLSEGLFYLGLHVRPGASRSGKLKDDPEGCIASIDTDESAQEHLRHGRQVIIRKCCCTPHPHFFLWASTGEWTMSISDSFGQKHQEIPFFVGSNGLGRHGTNTLKPPIVPDEVSPIDDMAVQQFIHSAPLVVARQSISAYPDGHVCLTVYSNDHNLTQRATDPRLVLGPIEGAVTLFLSIIKRLPGKVVLSGTIPQKFLQFLPQQAFVSFAPHAIGSQTTPFMISPAPATASAFSHQQQDLTQSPSASNPHSEYTSGDEYSSPLSDLSPVGVESWFVHGAQEELSHESSGSSYTPDVIMEPEFFPVDDDVIGLLDYWEEQKNSSMGVPMDTGDNFVPDDSAMMDVESTDSSYLPKDNEADDDPPSGSPPRINSGLLMPAPFFPKEFSTKAGSHATIKTEPDDSAIATDSYFADDSDVTAALGASGSIALQLSKPTLVSKPSAKRPGTPAAPQSAPAQNRSAPAPPSVSAYYAPPPPPSALAPTFAPPPAALAPLSAPAAPTGFAPMPASLPMAGGAAPPSAPQRPHTSLAALGGGAVSPPAGPARGGAMAKAPPGGFGSGAAKSGPSPRLSFASPSSPASYGAPPPQEQQQQQKQPYPMQAQAPSASAVVSIVPNLQMLADLASDAAPSSVKQELSSPVRRSLSKTAQAPVSASSSFAVAKEKLPDKGKSGGIGHSSDKASVGFVRSASALAKSKESKEKDTKNSAEESRGRNSVASKDLKKSKKKEPASSMREEAPHVYEDSSAEFQRKKALFESEKAVTNSKKMSSSNSVSKLRTDAVPVTLSDSDGNSDSDEEEGGMQQEQEEKMLWHEASSAPSPAEKTLDASSSRDEVEAIKQEDYAPEEEADAAYAPPVLAKVSRQRRSSVPNITPLVESNKPRVSLVSTLQQKIAHAAASTDNTDRRTYMEALIGKEPKGPFVLDGNWVSGSTEWYYRVYTAGGRPFAFLKSGSKYQTWQLSGTQPEACKFIQAQYQAPILKGGEFYYRRRWQDLFPRLQKLDTMVSDLPLTLIPKLLLGLTKLALDLSHLNLLHFDLSIASFAASVDSLRAGRVILTATEGLRSFSTYQSNATLRSKFEARFEDAMRHYSDIKGRTLPAHGALFYSFADVLNSVVIGSHYPMDDDEKKTAKENENLALFLALRLTRLENENILQQEEFDALVEEFDTNGYIDVQKHLRTSAVLVAPKYSRFSEARAVDTAAHAAAALHVRQSSSTVTVLGNCSRGSTLSLQGLLYWLEAPAWKDGRFSISWPESATHDQNTLGNPFVYVVNSTDSNSEFDQAQLAYALCVVAERPRPFIAIVADVDELAEWKVGDDLPSSAQAKLDAVAAKMCVPVDHLFPLSLTDDGAVNNVFLHSVLAHIVQSIADNDPFTMSIATTGTDEVDDDESDEAE